MDLLIWILIWSLFIISIVGIVIPIIPTVFFIWGGFLLYHFLLNDEKLSLFFWLMMLGFTLILLLADIFTNRYFVQRFGGSKKSEWAALIGILVGMFVFPPFGIILVPFLFVLLIEWYVRKDMKLAFLASIGALVGFLSGVLAKVFISLIMIGLFFIFIL